jgi:hypothetical protein
MSPGSSGALSLKRTTEPDSRAIVIGIAIADSLCRSTSRDRSLRRNIARVQSGPIQSVDQRGELRGAQPHHAVADRRNASCSSRFQTSTRPDPCPAKISNGRPYDWHEPLHRAEFWLRIPSQRGGQVTANISISTVLPKTAVHFLAILACRAARSG